MSVGSYLISYIISTLLENINTKVSCNNRKCEALNFSKAKYVLNPAAFLTETLRDVTKLVLQTVVVLQEKRQLCVDELVRVKGVISLTFNMSLRRCIVRAKAELTAEVSTPFIDATFHHLLEYS